ncbi:hypothetical protein HK105_206367 [Polyrhizophydium stewartii]|uniref:Ankyrin repeat protein n=1 Tax=Polyrhizophydium stewartii TaxID=2732419 RepID=A0ABR4N3Q4_9FUNG
MADTRTNDAPAAALAASPPPAQPAAAHADPAAALATALAPLAAQLVEVNAKLDAVQAKLDAVKSELAAATAQHDRLAERLDGQPAPPPAVSPPLAAAPASTTSQPPPSTTSEAARTVRFRPDATNEWDRMPAEIQNMILAHAGDLTLWLNGRIDDLSNISLEQVKALLCYVFETNWEGDLTKLPFKKLKYSRRDETFWRIRSRGMHARVKLLGLKFLQDGLDQAAIRNGWTDLLDFDKPERIGRNAARCGSISMLQHLVDERKAVTLHMDHAEAAAMYGHLEVLKWLHERMPNRNWTPCVMHMAARNGHLDVVKFLHANRTEGCTKYAMDYAAENGHLDVVKWLHSNRTEGCSTDAMDDAARNGHLDVVKWLHANRTEGCSTYAMGYAAKNGHLDVVRWLHANRTEGCTTYAMNYAAENGHLDVVKWLHANRTEGCSTDAIKFAAENGHLAVVKWLLKNRTEGSIAHAADSAARNGQLAVIQYIHKLAPDAFTVDIINAAAAYGHVSTLEWLVSTTGVLPTTNAITKAVKLQRFRMLPWFRKHIPDMFYSHSVSRIGDTSADDVIDWLSRPDLPTRSGSMSRLAIEERNIVVLEWMLEVMGKKGWLSEDLNRARRLVDGDSMSSITDDSE